MVTHPRTGLVHKVETYQLDMIVINNLKFQHEQLNLSYANLILRAMVTKSYVFLIMLLIFLMLRLYVGPILELNTKNT